MEKNQVRRVFMTLFSLLCLSFVMRMCRSEGADLPSQPKRPRKMITNKFKAIKFDEGFSTLWGSDHQNVSQDGMSITLKLDRYSGSGFKSKKGYMYGFFNAAMKLPPGYTAGIITTFYLSNNEMYPGWHDEVDFEFLGTILEEPYTLQTNVYGNGTGDGNSNSLTGREVQFHLWFDPTLDFHNYSLLWSPQQIVYLVDGVVIRQFKKIEELGLQYPAKPMWIYATIWDASDWATDGGKYKANYTYEPFVSTYKNLIISGCEGESKKKCSWAKKLDHVIHPSLSSSQRDTMGFVRSKFIKYDYCNDTARYPSGLPECPGHQSLLFPNP